MGRSPCCDETGLKKGPWTAEEDEKLINYIKKNGHGSWRALPKLAGLNRCGKSCRLRWTNYLRPDIKRGKFTPEEEQTILNLHSVLGNKWSTIATHLPGRTDNEIKNFWNTHLKKKLIQMGFDPMTHRPRTDIFSSIPHLIALANLMEQNSWEKQAVRLQNEAAAQMVKFQYFQYLLQPPSSSSSSSPMAEPFSNINISTNVNILNDFEAYNLLLNSLSKDSLPLLMETSSMNIPSSFLSNTTTNKATIQPSIHDSIPFSHMPDLESCLSKDNMVQSTNFSVLCSTQEENSPASPWRLPTSPDLSPASSSPPPPAASQPVAIAGSGDGCSTSSYEGGPSSSSSIWPEILLDDPLFHDLA